MDKCPFCGSEITEGAKFCGSCGHPLTDSDPAEAPVDPSVETTAVPTEAPAPTEAPFAPVQQAVPVYNAPEQNMPGYGTMTQTAVNKNKKGMVLAIVAGVIVVLGIIAAVIVFVNGSSDHRLDGEYKLSALKVGDEDYSSYISYMASGYRIIIDGSDCVIESPGYTNEVKIDQRNHTISSGDFGTVEFTVDGSDITLELNSEYTMTFTRQ